MTKSVAYSGYCLLSFRYGYYHEDEWVLGLDFLRGYITEFDKTEGTFTLATHIDSTLD